jgi:hypothetical protein
MKRLETVIQELPKGEAGTGLKAKMYVMVDHSDGKIMGIRFSHKHKEESHTLDKLLTQVEDAINPIIREIQDV